MRHTVNGSVFSELTLESFKLAALLVAQGDKLAESAGLSSAKWKILGVLAQARKPLTVPQIGRSMNQSRQAVQRLVDLMRDDGLLLDSDNPNHKKARLFRMSDKGQKIFVDLNELQVPWANEIAENIDRQELKTALKVLKQISSSVNKP